jgi:hypothetical protein
MASTKKKRVSMSDIVLKDGTEVTFDLSKLTRKDYKGFFNPANSDSSDDEKLANITGLTLKDIEAMEYMEYRRFVAAFFRKCREPLADPNSPGAST